MNELDEWVDQKIDWLCEHVPKWLKPRVICLMKNGFVWRVALYIGTAGRNIRRMFSEVNTDDKVELVLRDLDESVDRIWSRIKKWIDAQVHMLMRMETRGRMYRFAGMLFLTMLSALGVVARGGSMGVVAASIAMMWLSVHMECEEIYLGSTLTRTGAIGLLIIRYWSRYQAQKMENDMVLAGVLMVLMLAHLVSYLMLILFNKRQPRSLRILHGIVGAVPAVTAAMAIALCVADLFKPTLQMLSALLGAMGSVSVFLGDKLIAAHDLGAIRLKYHSIWLCLLLTGGCLLILLGAWLY